MKNSGWLKGGVGPELPFSNSTTSREAAESISAEAGKTMRWKVFAAVARSGTRGVTDDEMEVLLGMSHQTTSARRRELVLKGLIGTNGDKRKTRSGRNAQVWRTQPDPAEQEDKTNE